MAKIGKIALIFLFFSVLPAVASAATLYFSPSSGSYAAGSVVTANIYVSSVDQAMNAASGVISFPSDKLEVTSLSKTGSIFSLWVQEPSFSNSAGTVNFEGIALNPGFIGTSGKLITVNFRVKAAGVAALNFSSGSILANDGKGTNILIGLGNAQFSLNVAAVGPQATESISPSVAAGTPLAPKISSLTHPDPEKWYANSNPKFVWSVPSDITAIRILYDKYPASQPGVVYVPAISEKQLEDIKDGVWYFHAQFKNAQGWGAISHFRFQIDTQPPEPFVIKFIDGKEPENPQPTVIFDADDAPSGINYYKVKIGEGNFFLVSSNETVKSNPYTLPLQASGKRTILVQAFDKAGNYTTASEEFIIKPLEAPIITDYTKELESGEPIMARGTTYPDSAVTLWLQRNGDEAKSFKIQSDKEGNFIFAADGGLKDGVYKLWAEATDGRGAKSLPTEKFTIVLAKAAIFRVGGWAISFLAIIVPFIALIFVLFMIVWRGWHKLSFMKKRLRGEVREAEQALHKAFNLLKENISEQIKRFMKRLFRFANTEEEEKIIHHLKENLDSAEKFIKKEIEDIEKEVK